MSRALLLAALLVATGCSSPAPGAIPLGESRAPAPKESPPSVASADETWADGKEITGTVTIPSGVTVTIASGAKIRAAKDASIVVAGTLRGLSDGAHASITGPTWGGIKVAAGGKLALDGVDISRGSLIVQRDGLATFDRGNLVADDPITIDPGGKLTTNHAHIQATFGQTSVNGSLVARFLDYDTGGNEGIVTDDPGATVDVEDATMYGIGVGSGDMIVSYRGASVRVDHSAITGVHCAFQFHYVTAFDISYVNTHDNGNSLLIAGSPEGTSKRVYRSNLRKNEQYGINQSGENGIIAVEGCYFAENGLGNTHLVDTAIDIQSPAEAPIPEAGPRQP